MQQMAPSPVALRRVLTSMSTTFHQGNRPCDHLHKKNTCIQAKEKAVRPGGKIRSGPQVGKVAT